MRLKASNGSLNLLIAVFIMAIIGLAAERSIFYAQAQSRPTLETSTVIISLMRDGQPPKALKKDDFVWPLKDYSLFMKKDTDWVPTNYTKNISLESDSTGNAVAIVELPPGKYRLTGHTTYQVGLACNKEFVVAADDQGKIKKLDIVHDMPLIKCNLTVKGENIGNQIIKLDQSVAIAREGSDEQSLVTTYELNSKADTPITFYTWPNILKISFSTSSYYCFDSEGVPQEKIFTLKELANGVEWTIKVSQPIAKIAILLQTEGENKPLTRDLLKSALPAIRNFNLVYALSELQTNNNTLHKIEDGGDYNWEKGELSYAFLKPGHVYVFPDYIFIDTFKLPIIKGAGTKVKLESGVMNIGTIIVGTKLIKLNEWKLQGIVKDVSGKPIPQVAITLTDEFGRKQIKMTNNDGQYTISAKEGNYELTVHKEESYPQNQKLNMTKDLICNYELKEMPSLMVSVPNSRNMGGTTELSLYGGIQGSGKRLGNTSEGNDVIFKGIPRGEHFVYVWHYPKLEKLKNIDPTLQTMCMLKVSVEDGKNNQFIANLDKGRTIQISFNYKPFQERVLLVLWYRWRESYVPVISAMTIAQEKLNCVVPSSGEYIAEIVQISPNNESGDAFRGAKALYSQPFKIEDKDTSADCSLIEQTQHKFNPWSEPDIRMIEDKIPTTQKKSGS